MSCNVRCLMPKDLEDFTAVCSDDAKKAMACGPSSGVMETECITVSYSMISVMACL